MKSSYWEECQQQVSNYWVVAFYFSIIGLSINTNRLVAQSVDHCDPSVVVSEEGPNSYQRRGDIALGTDRCEGLVALQYSSTAFQYVSFTSQFAELSVGVDEPLAVRWPVGVGDVAHVKAVGIKRRLFYRMDATRRVGVGELVWPIEVLSLLGVEPDDIGLLGWTYDLVEQDSIRLHLPLSIEQGDVEVESGDYILTFFSRRSIGEIIYEVTNEIGELVIQSRALEWGYYPDGKSVQIRVEKSQLIERGRYNVEITLEEKGSINKYVTNFWFFHQGE